MTNLRSLICILFVLIFAEFVLGQNRYEGYSMTVEANEDGACPIRYLPGSAGGNAIDIFIAGTNFSQKAPNITACDGSAVQGGKLNPNGLGKWCFAGPESMYEIKLSSGVSYLWYPVGLPGSGIVDLRSFRPVNRTADGKYVFSEPKDYTSTFKNAVAYLAARQGGTLVVPDGDYIVGTLDGERRDPSFNGITLASGINIVGAGSNASAAASDAPNRFSSTRIRLRNPKQSIFRIGGCTNQVRISDLELLGNAGLLREPKRDTAETYGIEALGKWAKDARTGRDSANTSQVFKFENLTIQNFEKGIYVHNVNDANCRDAEQLCGAWQFDYVKVDSVLFLNNATGLEINTFNTDWSIANSVFNYIATFAPGDGIRIRRGGAILLQQTFGGGYDLGPGIGGTFINIDTVTSLTVINSSSERSKRSIYTNPLGAIGSMMITVVGGGFGDLVELHGNLNYISTGNSYGPETIKADPTVTITSTGDRFCYDPRITPGYCKDSQGRTLTRPNVTGGRIMFQTGRLPEGSGPNRIDGKPNVFGYTVELRDGLMQYDPNITLKDIEAWSKGGDGRPPVQDGAIVYCKDCRRGGLCSQGSAGSDGAFAKRINGRWMCD